MSFNQQVAPAGRPAGADIGLFLQHLPVRVRAAAAALFGLDAALATVLRTTSQPLIGQMRLTWWHDALVRLGDGGGAPAEPVLTALAAAGVDGGRLLPMVEGWEALLADPLDEDAMLAHAAGRGATLFDMLGVMLDPEVAGRTGIAQAGEGWALADLSRHLSAPRAAAQARGLALAALTSGPSRWPRPLRPLGTLAALARHDATRASPAPQGSPRRAAIMLAHRLTGR